MKGEKHEKSWRLLLRESTKPEDKTESQEEDTRTLAYLFLFLIKSRTERILS